MYQVNNTKRYNVRIINPHSKGLYSGSFFQEVELLAVAANFVALRDKNGKEHIYSGSVLIEIDEC